MVQPAFAVWPENLFTVNTYIAMDTQWRMSGGMDYSVLPVVMRMQSVPRSDWNDTFECLRVMEGEAIRIRELQRV